MKKLYILLFTCTIFALNAADNTPALQDCFSLMPHEIALTIFRKLHLQDMLAMRSVDRLLGKISSQEEVKCFTEQSPLSLKKQVMNGLTTLSIPGFCSWHKQNKKNRAKVADILLNIITKKHTDKSIVKRAMIAYAKNIGEPTDSLLLDEAKKSIENDDLNGLTYWIQLGADPQSIEKYIVPMYERLFSRAIQSSVHETSKTTEAIHWLNMGIEPKDSDYAMLTAICKSNDETLSRERFNASHGLGDNDPQTAKNQALALNASYCDLLTHITTQSQVPMRYKKRLKKFKKISQIAQEQLRLLEEKNKN